MPNTYLPGFEPLDSTTAGAVPVATGTGVIPEQTPEPETSFLDGAVAARHLYGTSNWAYRAAQQAMIPADPSYRITQDYNDLIKDVPEHYVRSLNDQLVEAKSSEEAWSIRNQFIQEMSWQEEIAKQGWKGAAATLAVGLLDEGNITMGLLGPIATLGRVKKIASAVNQLSRTRRYLAYAAAGAAENAALEAAGVYASKSRDPVDIVYAAALGGLFGTVAGHFTAPSLHPHNIHVPETQLHVPEPDIGAAHAANLERADRHVEETINGTAKIDPEDPVATQADRDLHETYKQTTDPESFGVAETQAAEVRPIMEQVNLKHAKASAELDAQEAGLKAQLEDVAGKLAKEPDVPPPKPAITDAITKARDVIARAAGRAAADPKTRTRLEQELTNTKRELLNTLKREAPDAFNERGLSTGMKNADFEKFMQKEVESLAKKAEGEHKKATAEYDQRIKSLEAEKDKISKALAGMAAKREKLNLKHAEAQAKAQAKAATEAVTPTGSAGAAAAEIQPAATSRLSADQQDEIISEAPAPKGLGKKFRGFTSLWAQLTNDINPMIRFLGNKLLTNHAGEEAGVASNHGAATLFEEFKASILAPYTRDYMAGYKEWLTANGHKWNRLWSDQRLQREYGVQVSAAIENINTVTDPNILKGVEANRKLFKDVKDFAERSGLEGFDEFGTRPDYFPHIHDLYNAGRLRHDYRLSADVPERLPGWGVDNELIYQGLTRANPFTDTDTLKQIAKKYMDIVHHKAAGLRGAYLDLARAHESGYIRSALEGLGLEADQVDEIDNLFAVLGKNEAEQGGRLGRAKSRAILDMSAKIQARKLNPKTGEYEDVVVPITDLFHRDAAQLAHSYLRSVGGRSAIASVFKGSSFKMANDKDWDTFIQSIREWEHEYGYQSVRSGKLESVVQDLQNVRNGMVGVPINPDTKWHNLGRTILRYNFVSRMGQMAWAATAETGNVQAQVGLRRMIQMIPEVRSMFARDAHGAASHPLVQLGEDEMGIAADILNNKNFGDHYDDVEFREGKTPLGTKALNGLQTAERIISWPLRKVMALQERMLLIGTWRRLADIANGREALSEHYVNAWADYGVSREQLTKVIENIRQHGQFDGKRLMHPNHGAWGDTDLWLNFKHGMFRMARRVVQENDPSNLPPVFHHTLGKMAFQFRTFQIGAIDKSLLYNVNRLQRSHYRDAGAWAELSYQLMWSAAGLYGMVMAKSLLMPEPERKKFMATMLDPKRFAAMAFARTGYSTLIPGTIDTAMWYTDNGSWFSQARSSGLHQNLVTGNPTVSLALGAARAVKGITASAFSSERDFSAKDLRAIQNVLPLGNLPGIYNLWNAAPDLFGLPETSKED